MILKEKKISVKKFREVDLRVCQRRQRARRRIKKFRGRDHRRDTEGTHLAGKKSLTL
jgi:hypothetical protein